MDIRRTVMLPFILIAVVSAKDTFPQSSPMLIDSHVHFLAHGQGPHSNPDYDKTALSTLALMDKYEIKVSIIMPHPFTPGQRGIYTENEFISVLSKHSKRFVWLGGGGSLNVLLHKYAKETIVSDSVMKEFTDEARNIIQRGARGFGEIAPEHFSMHAGHPYESAPPDHPLLLALADIAAELKVPIEIHMECIPSDMPLPDTLSSWANPGKLKGNLDAFTHLLAYNRDATIIWSHLGWDNTGMRNPALMTELLKKNKNLYMNIKFGKDAAHNRLLDSSQKIPAPWITLIEKYSDRIMFASDQFYTPYGTSGQPERVSPSLIFLSQLPPKTRRLIGYKNAAKIFNIKE